MWHNLSALFDKLSVDPNVRAVVFSGAGRAFTAGLDVQAASEGSTFAPAPVDSARKANGLRRHILEFQDCITSLEKCEKPVICVLHGISFGLALDMSLSCDVRISTADTKFSVKEVDIGLAADIGMTCNLFHTNKADINANNKSIGTLSRLPHAVGNMSWIKDVALSARVFGSEEALRVGLVSRVAADKTVAMKEALELASLIASKSPVAVLGTKEILNYSRDKTVAEGLNYTAVWNAAMLQTEDVKEAMLSGMQKRKVKFAKL